MKADQMEEIQQHQIIKDKYTKAEVLSADNTGISFEAPPKHQLVPKDAERAAATESDEKFRFTAMLFGAADGMMMGPVCAIVKCLVTSAHLSSAPVLSQLHLEVGFMVGWLGDLNLGDSRTLARPACKGQRQRCNRGKFTSPPLSDPHGVACCEHRAVKGVDGYTRILMWDEIQVQAWPAWHMGRELIIWEDCRPHEPQAIKESFERTYIKQEELTPMMTDVLQVMDLIANGPMKSGIRRERCEQLFEFFQSWNVNQLKAQVIQLKLPKLHPPKPKVVVGLLTCPKSAARLSSEWGYLLMRIETFESTGVIGKGLLLSRSRSDVDEDECADTTSLG